MATALQVTMAYEIEHEYRNYEWQDIHSDIIVRCSEVRKQFLLEKKQNKALSRVDIIHRYAINGSLLAIQCVPKEEIVAVLQYCEMKESANDIYRGLIFDAICNLWINVNERDVKEFADLSTQDQLDHFMKIETEFLQWYTTIRRVSLMELRMLMEAVHMPLFHKLSDHSTLDLMISYLFC